MPCHPAMWPPGLPRAKAYAADAIGHLCSPATITLPKADGDQQPKKVDPKLFVSD